MTTNSDILSFLKATQEDHAKEKEEAKMVRAKERKEDMDYMISMIQKSIQEKVSAAIKPLEERLEIQEKVNQELSTQFNSLLNEMEALKKIVKLQDSLPSSQKEFPRLSLPIITGESRIYTPGENEGQVHGMVGSARSGQVQK